MNELWVIDDDRSVRFVLAQALREAGYTVREFGAAAEALDAMQSSAPALVFTDVRMPGMDGLHLLDALKQHAPQLPVIVMSAFTDVPSTAGAFRGGAHDFLSKPFDIDAAVAMARRALNDTAPLPAESENANDEHALLGDSPAMRELFRAVGRLSQAPLSVLIVGETGTGKELVARALHRHSPRAKHPFIALNTAAIPAELLESELFGHEAGAFTGAAKRHVGRFEQADGGTLFLDEIGDMPLGLQTRLLRVLAEGEFFRVGGRELLRVDVRVVAATHQNLDQAARDGRFRADLLHRLDVVRLALPPLRERREDIPALARQFIADAARRIQATPKQFAPATMDALRRHPWPGNVRELENLCWRLMALAPGDTILLSDLPQRLSPGNPDPASVSTDQGDAGSHDWERALRRWAEGELVAGRDGLHPHASERLEQILLEAALAATGGRKQEAARRLGVGRNTLTRKLGPGRPRER
ncbi:nitrogen regulation protein NR(I) [Xanthomonadaceae bacterium JHOS43]|nr:nitrogen regulation protein NR(I) [Xanthomonadaceae bacterium JHOS43]